MNKQEWLEREEELINPRTKGANGEREFCEWLQYNLGLEHKPERNLEQVRHGGHDVMIGNLMFEVKRCEKLKKKAWWMQVIKASERIAGSIPVVAYRMNRKPWVFLISAKYLGLNGGFIQLEEREFKSWLKLIVSDV